MHGENWNYEQKNSSENLKKKDRLVGGSKLGYNTKMILEIIT
jgi:hypothetical protein